MKEVDLIPDDPKSAECIKQLQQVTPGISVNLFNLYRNYCYNFLMVLTYDLF